MWHLRSNKQLGLKGISPITELNSELELVNTLSPEERFPEMFSEGEADNLTNTCEVLVPISPAKH